MDSILTVQTVNFIAAVLVVPLLLIAFNFIVRSLRKWYYTSGSDILLLLVTTNLSLPIVSTDMSAIIKNESIKEALTAVYIVLGIFTLICWLLVVFLVEEHINKAIAMGTPRKSIGITRTFFSWTAVGALLALNLVIILYP